MMLEVPLRHAARTNPEPGFSTLLAAAADTVIVVHACTPPAAVAHTLLVPAATGVTKPAAFTVATDPLLLDHVNVTPLVIATLLAFFAAAVICCVAFVRML